MSLTLWKGNLLPLLTDTITSDGLPVDLSSATVNFRMRPELSDRLVIDAPATIPFGPSGAVSYAWQTADVERIGNFICWWQVTSGGKTQDTPEFRLTIVEHAPAAVQTPAPVDPSGQTTILRGDAYLDADQRALQYELDLVDIVDLTGLVVTWRVAPALLSKTMTVVAVDAVKVDLSSTDTALLATGVYQFAIVATTSAGNSVTLLHSTLTVQPAVI